MLFRSRVNFHLVCKNNTSFNGVEDLVHKNLAIISSDGAAEILISLGKEYSNVKVVNNLAEALDLIKKDSIDYLIGGAEDFINSDRGIDKDIFSTHVIDIEPIEICYSSSDFYLIREINKALLNYTKTKEFIDIFQKWTDYNSEKETSSTTYWILGIIIFISTILLFFIILQRIKMSKTKSAMESSRDVIDELMKSVAILNQRSNIDIYLCEYTDNKKFYVLSEGKFVLSDIDLEKAFENTHPEDYVKAKKDFGKMLSGTISEVKSAVRILYPDLNKYRHFEYIAYPLKKDSNGRITRFIYSRRDITDQKEHEQKQNEDITKLNLAIKSGNFLRWEYKLQEKVHIIIDSNGNEILYTINELDSAIANDDKLKVSEYFLNLISEKPVKDKILVRIKFKDRKSVV